MTTRTVKLKLAKATPERIEQAYKLNSFICQLTQDVFQPDEDSEPQDLDIHDSEQMEAVFNTLTYLSDSGHLALVIMNAETLLSPKNQLVDETKSVLDFHPRIKQGQWVSVSDSLPEEGKRVLVYLDGEIYIDEVVSSYGDDGNLILGFESSDKITHWHPLPEPPSMDK